MAEASGSVKPEEAAKEINKRHISTSATVKKRMPPRGQAHPNEIYVTNKSDFKGIMKKCFNVLENSDEEEITLKGLGAALPRTVNLALQIQEKLGPEFVNEVRTSTVQLVDDLEGVPEVREQTRNNSAISVRIYKQPNVDLIQGK